MVDHLELSINYPWSHCLKNPISCGNSEESLSQGVFRNGCLTEQSYVNGWSPVELEGRKELGMQFVMLEKGMLVPA